MARIVKKHDERKNEIMYTARMLFNQHGYDSTPVNLIIETIGISKGTFYHYFKTKEDLLNQIVEDFSLDILEKLKPILDDPRLNAIDKFNLFYRQGGLYKIEQFDMIRTLVEVLQSERNLLLKHKLLQRTFGLMLPVLIQIIEEGNSQGHFRVKNPAETAKFIIISGQALSDITGKLILEFKEKPGNLIEMENLLKVYEKAIQGVLGAPEGKIRILEVKLFERIKDLG